MPEPILQNSLVSYKRNPARVIAVADKLEIVLGDGRTRRVRPKDVLLIHPGPVQDVSNLAADAGEDVKTVCELIGDDPVTLPELAELLYGDASPASRWNSWQWVNDGVYFHGNPDGIRAHPPEKAEQELADREARAKEEQAWNDFLQRIRVDQAPLPEDGVYLRDVEDLAFGRTGQSRLLRKLGVEQTPMQAHALLLRIGHWTDQVNPYPVRLGLETDSPRLAIPALETTLPTEGRRDLTHLPAFAIDDEDNQDPDDALSLEGERLWVHVADVAFAVTPNSPVDREAGDRGATLYLPERIASMLPGIVAEEMGLGKREISPALSFGLDLDADGAVRDLEIVPSLIRVERLTYASVQERLGEAPFCDLWKIAQAARARRRAAGAIFITLPDVAVRVVNGKVHIRPLAALDSRILVGETMIMAGEATARFAIAHEIPFPFITQAGVNLPPEKQKPPETLVEMYGYRRKFAPRQMGVTPGPHEGLGISPYTQVTSPLRRYLDLVAHQQLRAFLQGEKPLSQEEIIERIGRVQIAGAGTRKGERLSNRHWTLVYLAAHPGWHGEGVLVEKGDKRGVVLIAELGLEASVRYRGTPELGQVCRLALKQVDLAQSAAYFTVESFLS